MEKLFSVSSSPHLRNIETTTGIMTDVLIALSPAAVFGCIIFGLKAVLLLITCIVCAVLAEFLWNLILKKPSTVGDLSAAVTGMLLGMNLSSEVPLWVAAIGSVVAIIVVKQMFGGIGCNFANPAIAARIVLLVSFPGMMTKFSEPLVDTVTSATPLAAEQGTYTLNNLFFGLHSGCIGETSAFLLVIGGLYLIVRRVISPVIPLCFIGTVAFMTLVTGGDVVTAVFGGGLILGAIFMATDYTTSPVTPAGKAVFGVGCGLITFVIRKFGSLPEGVSYSILVMNILVPYINKLTLSKPFGFVPAKNGGGKNG